MKTLLVLLVSLLLAGVAEAQVSCVQFGQFLRCDGPDGYSSTQLDLGRGQGVVSDSKGNVTPYAVIPPPSEPRTGLPTLQHIRPLPGTQPAPTAPPVFQPFFSFPAPAPE